MNMRTVILLKISMHLPPNLNCTSSRALFRKESLRSRTSLPPEFQDISTAIKDSLTACKDMYVQYDILPPLWDLSPILCRYLSKVYPWRKYFLYRSSGSPRDISTGLTLLSCSLYYLLCNYTERNVLYDYTNLQLLIQQSCISRI